ncbi:MAG TPA: hypothetical protein VF337_04975 [Candidatus Limnocylindrales bacterium]
MQPAIRYDFDELVQPLLGLAESMLENEGEFHPFGARLAAGGQMALVDVTPTLTKPSNPLIIDALYATFRLEARAGSIRACAVCWDALVPRQEGGGLIDAIAIGLEHRDGDPTIVLRGYEREPTGDIRFEEPVTAVGRRHVFGHVLFS